MKKNLFDLYPFTDVRREQFEILIETGGLDMPGNFRLERILSFGQTTPEGEWYDQGWTEWVAVLKGMAILAYENGESITLRAGDHLLIRPNQRHRVSFTSDDCFWLAFHYNE